MKTILSLLPHSGKMILLDEIISYKENQIITKYTISDSNPFVKDGFFYTYESIEIMAQSIGAYKGLMSINNASLPGFLVGVRNFEIFVNKIEIGKTLKIIANCSIQDNEGFGVWDCEIYIEDMIIAKAALSVFAPSANIIEDMRSE